MKKTCRICNKPLKLLEETMGLCRCNEFFCPKHRHITEHSCKWDYIGQQKQLLEKSNPVVSSKKLNL